jgi:beta-glucuronidase
MAAFRTRPFVVGAIFWTYQDYRTRTNFIMGVVDGERNRRGSWSVLREAYSPVLIDSVKFSSSPERDRTVVVGLKTRGPVEMDMPAYTLWDYRLKWSITSLDGEEIYSKAELSLPTLDPGSEWEGKIIFDDPGENFMLNLSIERPTGYSVIEQAYDSDGNPLPWNVFVSQP